MTPFFKLFNRASSKTGAKPSSMRAALHAAKRKDSAGIHNLTPDRVARINAAARTAEYRDRVKEKPSAPKDETVVPVHQPNGPIEGAMPEGSEETANRAVKPDATQNGKACGDSYIADDRVCHAGESAKKAQEASDKANASGKPEDHRAAEEAHVQAAMAYTKANDNKAESADTRANATRNLHHATEAKKHADAAAGRKHLENRDNERADQLKNAATAIETVRRQLQDVVRADARLNVPPAATSAASIQGAPWVQDIITPDDSGVWTAIVSRPDGKMVKVRFTMNSGALALTADAPVETGMEVIYNRADALGILVEATDKLTNRFSVPEDGWIHIAPPGNHAHPKGVVQVLDDRSFDGMVNAFNARKQADAKFPGVLVDFDHFSQSGDKPSEAAGWIENLQRRDDGLWAQVRWTDVGEKAVNGGRYRLVSPVWLKRDCETLDGNKVRPMRLDSVALTNEPNLKGLTPISK